MKDTQSSNPETEGPFASIQYFDSWLQSFGGKNSGIYKWTEAEGESAMAYVSTPMRVGLLRVAAITGATNDHTARYDIVGHLSDPSKIIPKLQQELGASVLRFDYLQGNSRLLGALRDCDKLLKHVDYCEDSPFVDCSMSWGDYWHGLGSTKQVWSRRERKLVEKLGATYSVHESWDRVEPVLPAVYEIEASGWKGKQGSAIKQDPETLEFYNRCIRYWADQGWLRLFLLELEGKLIAFQITVLYEGTIYQIKVGYEEQYAKLSPGQVLQLQLLRWAFQNPAVNAYDMLGGGGKAAGNKRKWATGVETLYTLWIFERNIGGLLGWLRIVFAPKLKAFIIGRRTRTNGAMNNRAGEGREVVAAEPGHN